MMIAVVAVGAFAVRAAALLDVVAHGVRVPFRVLRYTISQMKLGAEAPPPEPPGPG